MYNCLDFDLFESQLECVFKIINEFNLPILWDTKRTCKTNEYDDKKVSEEVRFQTKIHHRYKHFLFLVFKVRHPQKHILCVVNCGIDCYSEISNFWMKDKGLKVFCNKIRTSELFCRTKSGKNKFLDKHSTWALLLVYGSIAK